jgi:hypothetical protein
LQRGGENLIQRDDKFHWYSQKLKMNLFFSEMSDGVHKLFLNWTPTTVYSSVRVIFTNGALAVYYSTDGQMCDVTINDAAADVQTVTALA